MRGVVMTFKTVHTFCRISFLALLSIAFAALNGCVSSKQALLLEKRVNCALMKGVQDNDEDLGQIEDGTGAIGEAAACPT